MAGSWPDVRSGVVDVAPALPANVAFGLVVGIAAVDVGLDPVETLSMSVLFFAGVAQLAAIDLLDRAAPAAVVVVTALVVNVRYLMYSASLAPYLRELPARWRWACAYFLIDVTYALAINRYRSAPDVARGWYFVGTALPIWVVWIGSIAAGVFVGARVPPAWHLEFAVPLLFVGLLVQALDDRAAVVSAAVGGTAAVAGAGLPFNAGLLAGALAGVLGGLVVGRWWA